MNNHLVKYFIQFGHLDIPLVGSLSLVKKEASLSEGKLIAPSQSIELEYGNFAPSKSFYAFLANALDLSIDQAIIQYEFFWSNNAKEGLTIYFGNLGDFKVVNDTYTWISNFDSSNYYSDITLNEFTPSLSNDEYISENNTSRWWIWPLVLALLAVFAILIK